jgi:hypothetical protein
MFMLIFIPELIHYPLFFLGWMALPFLTSLQGIGVDDSVKTIQ